MKIKEEYIETVVKWTKEKLMGFWDKYGGVIEDETESKQRTWEEIVDTTIEEQILIHDESVPLADKPRTTKKNKDTGEYPVKPSWWKKGKCKPKLAGKPLLGSGKGVSMDSKTFAKFLEEMKGWRKIPDLKAQIDEAEQAYLKQMAALAKTRKK